MIKKKSGILQALERLAEIQVKVWNLKMLEEKLFKERRSGDCFTIRQVLDLLASNWRIAEHYDYLEIRDGAEDLLRNAKAEGIEEGKQEVLENPGNYDLIDINNPPEYGGDPD